jgi:LemA protein
MLKKFVLIAAFCLSLFVASTYNNLKASKSEASSLWSQMNTQLIRRTELVSDLSITMRKFIPEKSEIFDGIDSRIKIVRVLNQNGLPTEQEFNQLVADQNFLTQARATLLDLAWSNESLRADGGFRNIQDQGDRTENRLIVQKGNLIAAASNFNITISQFPNNLIASLLGFSPILNFESPYWSGPAPKNLVDFSK